MIGALMRLGLAGSVVAAGLLAGRAIVDVIDVSPLNRAERTALDANVAEAKFETIPPLDVLRETRERPLFAPDRRPVMKVEDEQLPELAQGLVLVGLMRPAGKDARALIRIEGQDSANWIALGGSIASSIVRDIRPDHVVLERGGRLSDLRLRPTRAALETPQSEE